MIWWLAARQVLSLLLPSLCAFVLIAAIGRDQFILLPAIFGAGGSPVLLMQVIPLLITSTLAHSLGQRLAEAEETAVRDTRRLDVLLVLTLTGLAVAAGISIADITGSAEAQTAGRNTAFLVGLMLIARVVHPHTVTGAPIGWVFITIFLGHADIHRPWPWAITLFEATSGPAMVGCLAVFVIGLLTLLRAPRAA